MDKNKNKMKKQGNNYISIILMILLFGAAGLTKAYALSQYSFKSGKLYYWITSSENRTVEVVCPDGTTWWEDFAKPTGGVNIPSTVTNTVIEGGITTTTTYSVTAIGDFAFAMCSGITSVSVPATVTQIGMHAFHYCTGITSISIGNNVASIGNWAFNQCTSLSSITFPSSVTTFGNGLFADCANLSSVTFNNQPTFIPQYTFYHCGNLSTINIPGTVTVIQHEAFLGCSGLASITLNSETPPTLQGSTVFDGVDKSIPINVPCGSTLAYMAVTGWNDFTNYQEDGACLIDFTDANVKARCVASATGWDINQDGELSVAEAAAVTDLGTVFKNNSQITTFDELQYFTGLTSIGSNAFSFCTNLTSIEIPNGVTYIDSYAFSYCSGLTSITIPNSLTSIGDGAFYKCSGLTSITIPNSVTSIGSYAFSFCTNLTSIEIPNGVTYIDSYAFSSCSSLTSITIPNSVTSIGSSAFSGCSGLTSITIPNSVTSIGSNAFSECYGLTSVYYTGDIAQWCGISFSNSYFSNPLDYGHNLYINNELVTNLIIPNSVTSIGSYVFSGCSGLTSVEIPNSVTSIDDGAFYECSGLTSITIPNSVTYIDSYAFSHCSGLTSITISNGVTIIYEYVFSYCSGLTSITIPNSVTAIGDGAFYKCSGLTSITIPNSVAYIGGDAFSYCSGLTSIEIPNSVAYIGGYAFSGCNSLEEVMMLGIIPPEIHSPAFDGTTCSIYVPYESVNVYKTSTYSWSTYASRIYPWLQKSIAGYGESTAKDKWVFISSPLTVNTAPTAIDNLIITETAANYDLYYFDQTGGDDGKEWKNYKALANDFTIANGQGYLYANAEDVNLVFKGDFNENDTEEVCLIYNNGKPFAGWNLVGNPFPVAASIGNRSFYRMNDLGTEIIAAEDPNIAALEGIFVHTDTNGETVTFAKASRCNESEERIIINLSSGVSPGSTTATVIDRAIVRLGEGEMLPKFQIRDNSTKIYIPQGGKDYAIACVSAGTDGACTVSTTDVNFKTAENGTYTLSVIIEGLELGYLHLIDNLTGADVNLLASPSYTFEAKASDYASRFRLVFSSICKDVDGDNATFAFYNGSAWVIANEGQATVQVVDVTGRVLSTETINGNVEVKVNAASGVYMLRLVNGENVKVQKVVVR